MIYYRWYFIDNNPKLLALIVVHAKNSAKIFKFFNFIYNKFYRFQTNCISFKRIINHQNKASV